MDIIFKDFLPNEMGKCYLLYEPHWAVWAEEPASFGQVPEAQQIIQKEIASPYHPATISFLLVP